MVHALLFDTRHNSLTTALCHGQSLATKRDFLLVFSFSQHQCDLDVVDPEPDLAVMAELQLVFPTINSSGE